MAFHEDHGRSIVKTVTYRILIIISNAIVIYLFTGNSSLTANFIGVTSVLSTILYFAHERMWNQIHWGKKHIQHHADHNHNITRRRP